MRKLIGLTLAIFALGMLASSAAMAGAKLQINDDSYFDLGYRIQFLSYFGQSDLDGDGEWDSVQDFKMRRTRFRLKGVINKQIEGFIQTDIGSGTGGSGMDMRVIDAFITYKFDPWAQVYMGLNMAPANRQTLTSSGALMAIDRPGMTYKALNWGGRALSMFSNSTYSPSSAGLSGEGDVRDTGATLFGSGQLADQVFLKYYLGAYDGVPRATTDDPHLAGRVQVNLFNAEGAYYNSSTYLGKKKTVGFGLSVDSQKDVGLNADDTSVDYMYFSGDVFAELPAGEGAVTLEGGFSVLDFDDAPAYMAAQGTGFYGQAGYYVNTWQPWVEFETWASDGDDDLGGYKSFRVGVTKYCQGQNANFKVGVEQFKPDVPFTDKEDALLTLMFGAYLTY